MNGEVRVELNSQITLLDDLVQAAGIVEGDRFVIEVVANDPDALRLQRIRASYAGALRDVFVEPDQVVEAERSSWGLA